MKQLNLFRNREANIEQPYRIGIIGTGFIGKGLVMTLEHHHDLSPSAVLTRTNTGQRTDFPRQDLLTNSVDKLLESSDIVIECSGDVIYATNIIQRVMEASLPVVTMDADFHVTTGSYFVRQGFITEAEGDQPGCLAALKEDVEQMGFKPLVYGNIKGFLNHNPTLEEMHFWAAKQNLSLQMTTSFTDGTKIQIEQALVANGLGADIAMPGLLGISSEDVYIGAQALAERAKALGRCISDYILSSKAPPGVFIIAEHDKRQQDYLRNFKLGEGPYYILLRNYHLCHLEIAKTLRRVLGGGSALLNNGTNPRISVAAIAKKSLLPGHFIERGIGSFDVRGTTVRIADSPKHVPIGLISNATILRRIEPGQMLMFDDVEMVDSLALRAWCEIAQGSPKSALAPNTTSAHNPS